MRSPLLRQWAPWAALAGAAAAGLLVLLWSVAILRQDRYGSGLGTIWQPINSRADEPAPEITRGVEISQTFVSVADGLREVDIQLATFDRANTARLTFRLSRGSVDGPVLRELEISATDIGDNQHFPFIFEPVADSAGDRFAVTLTSPDGRWGNAVTAWTGLCDCYTDGSLYIDGEKQRDQELTMLAGHTSDPASVSGELLNRMSQYKPELVKGVALVALGSIWGVLSLICIGFLILGLVQRTEDKFEWPWVALSLVGVIFLYLAIF